MHLHLCRLPALISAVRGPDGFDKDSNTKPIARWFRRSILESAFEGEAINNPYTKGGGSFTGPIDEGISMDEVMDDYFSKMDSIPIHYYLHFMHAAEIIGYKHPLDDVRSFWHKFYIRCVHKMHIFPESEKQLDSRLGDNSDSWKAREA